MFKRVNFFLLLTVFFSYTYPPADATIVTCIGSTTIPMGYNSVYISLSSSTNGTVSFNDYAYKIICNNLSVSLSVNTVSTSTGCSAGYLPLFNVSNTNGVVYSNAHVEDPAVGKYSKTLCLNGAFYPPDYSYATITSKLGNCDGYGTTLFSAPSYFTTTGNTHIGDANAYPMKRCLTLIRGESISVAYSSNSVGFGNLSSSQTRYATSDGLGTSTPLTATSSSFYIDVNTTGNNGYVISLEGPTLTNQNSLTKTITKIGATPTVLTTGIEQFGVSATTTCVNTSASRCSIYYTNSSISYPYNTSDYAYAGDTGLSTILGHGPPDDGVATYGGSRFYVRLAANIAPLTPAGNYSTNLVVIVTPEF